MSFISRTGIILSTTLLLTTVFIPLSGQTDGHENEHVDVQLVRKLINNYERLDWDAVADTFAEQGTLHSVMRAPFSGREIIRDRLIKFHKGIESMQLDILHIVKVDEVVIVERMDHFVINGVNRRIPAVGVLSIEHGKVTLWKEYYDLESLLTRLNPDYPGDD